MEKLQADMKNWGNSLLNFHLPRWEELPTLELYMDQVITLIDQYLSPVIQTEKHPLLTSSMVNNYVKKGMIPSPEKKRYNQKHLAFLIAITMLKQVLTIPEIKTGILFQGKAVGIRNAYNVFCEEQEKVIHLVGKEAMGEPEQMTSEPIPIELVAMKGATRSFANKLLAEKTIELEVIYLETHKGEAHE
ncbi:MULTISPECIES: DUF1836 domain-containing protein [Enterococcus]|uniref:DUF1836 domain-containing protein n=1 Tax=Enterococcus TaxID=1350 RepID=UPI00265C36B7|nr:MULTISPECIES: DUF1836 domain-containing protein [unclassified Enterococcus]MDO0893849.1 DUF1836 domain-containing protein [Enterococcus sp. B1E4]MDO0906688.1 DUF1836 domain-containing protein [Enterococcus sp. B2E4]MDR3827263.1 DUF1836 domain-containing protein [Enterococcus sp.]